MDTFNVELQTRDIPKISRGQEVIVEDGGVQIVMVVEDITPIFTEKKKIPKSYVLSGKVIVEVE